MINRQTGFFSLLLIFAVILIEGFFSVVLAVNTDDLKNYLMGRCEAEISLFENGTPLDTPATQKTIIDEKRLYQWKFDKTKTEAKILEAIKSYPGDPVIASMVSGVEIINTDAQNAEWYIIDWRSEKMWMDPPQKQVFKASDGPSSPAKIDTVTQMPMLEYGFPFPSDPKPSLVVLKVNFEIRVTASNGTTTNPIGVTMLGKRPHLVLDTTPPSEWAMDPAVLTGVCGEPLTRFEEVVAADGLSGIYNPNKQEIQVVFVDNNPSTYFAEKAPGGKHDHANIKAFLFVETYVTEYEPLNGRRPRTDDLWKVEETTGERYKDNGGIGKMYWLDPIPLANSALATAKIMRFTSVPQGGDPVTELAKRIIEFDFPLSKLEQYFKRTIYDASGNRTGVVDCSKMPVSMAVEANFKNMDPLVRDRVSIGMADKLLITAAFCDSSGNWLLPDPALFENDPQPFEEFLKANGLKNNPPPPIRYHRNYGYIQIFDQKRPNPVLIMTNTETGQTTTFTIPNGDTQPEPYKENSPEWVFTYDGSGPTMAKLDPAVREKYMKALTINEDVRLIFKILAYDNINREGEGAGNDGSFCHGIITPIVGSALTNRELVRYRTWTIIDPTVANENLLYEDPAEKIYRWPDYIFRNAVEGKEYAVEFTVHDGSLYRDPPRAGSPHPGYMNFENIKNRVNSRKLKLVFGVGAVATKLRKVSGYDSIRSTVGGQDTVSVQQQSQ